MSKYFKRYCSRKQKQIFSKFHLQAVLFLLWQKAKKIAPGTPVTLAVRSENMIFDETCQSGMEAVVVEKSFAGGLLRVVLKLADGTEVIANRHGIDAGVQPGQKVTCHFDAENAVLVDLPSETESGAAV
mgnify:CR=1 FL=1